VVGDVLVATIMFTVFAPSAEMSEAATLLLARAPAITFTAGALLGEVVVPPWFVGCWAIYFLSRSYGHEVILMANQVILYQNCYLIKC
jgi:hypothetical protein